VTLFDTTVAAENVAALLLFLLLVVASAVLLERFLRSDLGMAVRATGDNGQMARALGIDVSFMLILGLTLANGFVALAGTLFVQNQGSTDLQTPVGMIVVALACLVLGETFTDREKLSRTIAGVASGAVLLRLLVAAAIRAGLDPNALKLITAAFALLALVLPSTIRRAFRRAAGGEPDD
jgi:putative ABC transport system permease protein